MTFSATALACLLALSSAATASMPACSNDATAQAGKLLAFHVGADARGQVQDSARALPAITNPANRAQKFLVLEVMGYVYKAEYRMRFIYYAAGTECLLMGQEILELARL